MLIWTFEGNTDQTASEHVNEIRTSRVLSPDRTWPDRWLSDGDLDESIKRSASDRLGDLVPQVRARTSPGVFHDMALLGLCLELSFSVLIEPSGQLTEGGSYFFNVGVESGELL